ncbi:MAG: methyltransferase domain-containing protein [Rhodanobacteraceae bacterium]
MPANSPIGVSHRRASARVAARLRNYRHRTYARCKLGLDPVYATIADQLGSSERPLLDIGCGLGLLGLYLRERGFSGAYRGLDSDASKIAEAGRAARGLAAFEVEVANAAHELPPFKGDIAVLDMLHYLGATDQSRVLRESATRVSSDGRLILRNVVREPNWRFRATVLEERFARAFRWTPGALHFPTLPEITAPLLGAGFNIEARPLWGRTPFNSYLIIASR